MTIRYASKYLATDDEVKDAETTVGDKIEYTSYDNAIESTALPSVVTTN